MDFLYSIYTGTYIPLNMSRVKKTQIIEVSCLCDRHMGSHTKDTHFWSFRKEQEPGPIRVNAHV